MGLARAADQGQVQDTAGYGGRGPTQLRVPGQAPGPLSRLLHLAQGLSSPSSEAHFTDGTLGLSRKVRLQGGPGMVGCAVREALDCDAQGEGPRCPRQAARVPGDSARSREGTRKSGLGSLTPAHGTFPVRCPWKPDPGSRDSLHL